MVRRALAVGLLTVGLLACGSDDSRSASESTSPTPPTGSASGAPAPASTAAPAAGSTTAGVPATAVPAVPAVLDFAAPTVGGGSFDARAYAGQPLALWFWAPY